MESFSLKGWQEKEEGGERWRDKQRGVSSFCSQYVFAVSWWSRSRRRQKAQFLLGRTMKTGLPSPPLPASPSSPSILSLCLRVRQVRRRLKEVLFRARFINGSKPPPSCSSTHKFFLKTMLHISDGAVSQTPHRILFFKSGSRSGWNIFQLFFFKNMFEFVVVWTISAKRQKTNSQNVSLKQKSHNLFFSFEMLLMSSSVIRRGTIREKRFLSAFKSPNPFVLLHSTEVWGCFFFRLKVLELRVSRRDGSCCENCSWMLVQLSVTYFDVWVSIKL